MKISELRDTSLAFFKKQFPKMPDYVVRDLIYKNYKNNPKELEWISVVDRSFWEMDWKKEKINVTMEMFDQDTQKRLKERAGGSKNPYEISNDAARHGTQKTMLQKGPSQEPIILYEKGNKYELVEGWHRTIQSLQMWPEGYDQIAWIGYGYENTNPDNNEPEKEEEKPPRMAPEPGVKTVVQITNPGFTGLTMGELLTQEEYDEAIEEFTKITFEVKKI